MTNTTDDKTDFKKTLDAYQAQRGRFRIVDVPDMQYLMIDGHGDPNTRPAFTEAVETVYPLAYKLKFASKRDLGRDYVVPPLEGLWWAEDMDSFTTVRDKSRWEWTLMLMVPAQREHHRSLVLEPVGSGILDRTSPLRGF